MSNMMKLANCNAYMAQRNGQGTPHNIGVKTTATLENIGHELKTNPPKVLAKTKRKFGAKRAEKQKKRYCYLRPERRGHEYR